jgi:hypothetical protein
MALGPAPRTKISSSDPPLAVIRTTYPTEPFLRSFTHQSSCPALDQVAKSTWIGGSTSRRSDSANYCTSSLLRSISD